MPQPAAEHGVVVAAFPDAAEAGVAMLRAGGNAVDAACAAAWALGVCEPSESGLGGQTTMLIRLADGRVLVLDGHSRAPMKLRRKLVKARGQTVGRCASTVPSTVKTLGEAQRRFGRLSLPQAMAPAIALAEDGYRITRLQRRLLRWTLPYFQKDARFAGIFLKPGGGLYSRGEVFRQPLLAATLRRIAKEGAEDFYLGGLAREIVEDMQAHGGLTSAADLAELNVPVERTPLSIAYTTKRGQFAVFSPPPPSGGVQVLLGLQILQSLARDWPDEGTWRSDLALATLAAFRERERWPDHPKDMNPSMVRWIVSPERAAPIADALKAGGGGPTPSDSTGEQGNTTHLCATDRWGNVVSLTQSIQSVFGAKVAHPTLGFVYNNYLSTCPRTRHAYRLRGGGLPQSNASPTLVTEFSTGRPVLTLGSAGSRRITSSVISVMSSVLDRGMSLTEAVSGPRAHPLLSGNLWVEEGLWPQLSGPQMRGRFRRVRVLKDHNYKLGAVQAIAWDGQGKPHGVADPRRDGVSRAE